MHLDLSILRVFGERSSEAWYTFFRLFLSATSLYRDRKIGVDDTEEKEKVSKSILHKIVYKINVTKVTKNKEFHIRNYLWVRFGEE